MKGNALRFPNIKAHILDLSSNKTEAYGVCNKVRVSLLTGAAASLDTALGLCLEDIEEADLRPGELQVQPATAHNSEHHHNHSLDDKETNKL